MKCEEFLKISAESQNISNAWKLCNNKVDVRNEEGGGLTEVRATTVRSRHRLWFLFSRNPRSLAAILIRTPSRGAALRRRTKRTDGRGRTRSFPHAPYASTFPWKYRGRGAGAPTSPRLRHATRTVVGLTSLSYNVPSHIRVDTAIAIRQWGAVLQFFFAPVCSGIGVNIADCLCRVHSARDFGAHTSVQWENCILWRTIVNHFCS